MKALNAQKIFEKLGAPFSEDELEWRAQHVFEGRDGEPPRALVVPYVQSRAIMNRLDSVLGWDRWENVVQELPGGGIIQGIKIWLSDTHSVTKFDGADRTNFEPTKGGISSAFKRSAVLFNIGRYLYSESAKWVDIHPRSKTQNDEYINDKKKKVSGYFTPPKLQGGNDNNGSNNNHGRQQPANHQKNLKQHSKVPSGMLECTFKSILDREGNAGKFLEVWLEYNGDLGLFYAIGNVREALLSNNLQAGDIIAISSHEENGNYILDNFVIVAAAA